MSSVSNKEKPPDVLGYWRSYAPETQTFELYIGWIFFFFNDNRGRESNVEYLVCCKLIFLVPFV